MNELNYGMMGIGAALAGGYRAAVYCRLSKDDDLQGESARAALMDGDAVAGLLSNACEAEQKGRREALERSLTKDEERIEVLEKMVLRLYEDMVAGRISEGNFKLMLEKTQTEQNELKTRVTEGRNRLVKEIIVHESIDDDKTRHISVEIHFNQKPIPEVEQVAA